MIAFGGVEIGSIKAQLAAMTIGMRIKFGSTFMTEEKADPNGNRMIAVAVLLVSSVRKMTVAVIAKRVVHNSQLWNCSKFSPMILVNPLSEIAPARLNPPPNRIKISQGIVFGQSRSSTKIRFFQLTGRIKSVIAPVIAMTVSVILVRPRVD